jgi:hypothetical protein
MALISKKPANQESGEPVEPDSEPAGHVEVTIDGPDAKRLAGLVDMAAIASSLNKRAAATDPSSDA